MRDIRLDDDEDLIEEPDALYCTCEACVGVRRFALAGYLEELAAAHPRHQWWWSDLDWPKIVDALADDEHVHHDTAEEMVSQVAPDPHVLLRMFHRDIAISGAV